MTDTDVPAIPSIKGPVKTSQGLDPITGQPRTIGLTTRIGF